MATTFINRPFSVWHGQAVATAIPSHLHRRLALTLIVSSSFNHRESSNRTEKGIASQQRVWMRQLIEGRNRKKIYMLRKELPKPRVQFATGSNFLGARCELTLDYNCNFIIKTFPLFFLALSLSRSLCNPKEELSVRVQGVQDISISICAAFSALPPGGSVASV